MKKVYQCEKTGRRRVGTINDLPSRTDPQYLKKCNVNSILAQHARTGNMTHLTSKRGFYADVSGITNLSDSLMQVKKAQAEFFKVPAPIRAIFGNDMARFVDFVNDPSNLDKCIEMGLVPRLASSDKVGSPEKANETKGGARGSQKEDKDVRSKSCRGDSSGRDSDSRVLDRSEDRD